MPLAAVAGEVSIFGEGGLNESLQAGLLLLGVCSSIFVASRLGDARCRSTTLLLGVLAALGLGRELDLHVLINPENLGSWGVRYRIDWWLSASVNPAVKALWACIFLLLGGLVAMLARRSAGPVDWRRARPRLMALTGLMYAVGFTCDDLLRGVIDLSIAQAAEETAELIAAAALLGATLGPESAVSLHERGGPAKPAERATPTGHR